MHSARTAHRGRSRDAESYDRSGWIACDIVLLCCSPLFDASRQAVFAGPKLFSSVHATPEGPLASAHLLAYSAYALPGRATYKTLLLQRSEHSHRKPLASSPLTVTQACGPPCSNILPEEPHTSRFTSIPARHITTSRTQWPAICRSSHRSFSSATAALLTAPHSALAALPSMAPNRTRVSRPGFHRSRTRSSTTSRKLTCTSLSSSQLLVLPQDWSMSARRAVLEKAHQAAIQPDHGHSEHVPQPAAQRDEHRSAADVGG